MIWRIGCIFIFMLLLTACGGAAPATEAPAATEPPAATQPAPTEAPAATELPAVQSPEAATQPPAPEEPRTPTPLPTLAVPTGSPTDTPLPTLDLPTEPANAPAQMVWDGVPTYPAESTPGFVFRVKYDPELWALTTDQFGFPALAHRAIPGCVISVTSGRGLPLNLTVEHDVWNTGEVTYDVGNVYENGVLKFITYTGGDGTIITGFQVDFEEQPDECRAYAVVVLSTLTSVPVSQATPTLTP